MCIDGVVGKRVCLTGLILRQAGGPSSNLGQCTKWRIIKYLHLNWECQIVCHRLTFPIFIFSMRGLW